MSSKDTGINVKSHAFYLYHTTRDMTLLAKLELEDQRYKKSQKEVWDQDV